MRSITVLLSALALSLLAFSVQANVVLGGTRIIYVGSEREATIALANKGMAPALVQAWMDDGAADSTPENSQAPFIVMPPITRIEPQQSQTLRVLFNGQALPADRESLFWLNVLEVPPLAPGAGDNSHLQLAIQSRIKVFYRPPAIAVSLHEAAQRLSWRLSRDGRGLSLVCHNASALHVAFARVRLDRSGQAWVNDEGTRMVAPGGEVAFRLKPTSTAVSHDKPDTIEFDYINDYGALKSIRASLAAQ